MACSGRFALDRIVYCLLPVEVAVETKLKGYASASAPWRRGVPWWLVMVEGIALLVVGIYALAAPDNARETVFAIFGLLLAGSGLGAAVAAFRAEPTKRTSFNGFRGGIGLSLGGMALLARFIDEIGSDGARVILAVGFLMVGVVSLAAILVVREKGSFSPGGMIWNVVLIVIAIIFFTGSQDNNSRLTLIGWVAIVFGVLLCAFGALLRSRAMAETAAPEAPTVVPTSEA